MECWGSIEDSHSLGNEARRGCCLWVSSGLCADTSDLPSHPLASFPGNSQTNCTFRKSLTQTLLSQSNLTIVLSIVIRVVIQSEKTDSENSFKSRNHSYMFILSVDGSKLKVARWGTHNIKHYCSLFTSSLHHCWFPSVIVVCNRAEDGGVVHIIQNWVKLQ